MIDSGKLKARMVERGITQRDLSKKTGYGLNHINEVLNNKISPRLDLVSKLCVILDISDDSDRSDIFFAGIVPNTEH